MKKLLISLSLAVASMSALSNIDTRGLTEAQVAELKAQAAQKAAENVNSNGGITSITARAADWGQQSAAAAEGFAKAMGIAARELNVSINEFLKSPAGILTAAIIIWYVAGETILSIFFGMLLLILGLVMLKKFFDRIYVESVERVPYSRFWGFWKGERVVKKYRSISDLRGEGAFFSNVALIAGVVLLFVVSGNIIL